MGYTPSDDEVLEAALEDKYEFLCREKRAIQKYSCDKSALTEAQKVKALAQIDDYLQLIEKICFYEEYAFIAPTCDWPKGE